LVCCTKKNLATLVHIAECEFHPAPNRFFRLRRRVARFFLVQHTKNKINQMDI
jgi:hypothetical protein